MEKRLNRDTHNQMIAGVASGIAEYFEIDPVWVRISFVVAFFAGLSGLLVYVILWIAIPKKIYIPYNEVNYQVNNAGNLYNPQPITRTKSSIGSLTGGITLIAIGGIFLLQQFDILPYWFTFYRLWPLALIIPGFIMLAKASKTKVKPVTEPAETTFTADKSPSTDNNASNPVL